MSNSEAVSGDAMSPDISTFENEGGAIPQKEDAMSVLDEEKTDEGTVADYVWPQPTKEQKQRVHPGGDAVTRVLKVTHADPDKRFWENNGQKTVHIGQYRFPRADKSWDPDRMVLELRRNGLVLIEDAFPDEIGHLCELNDCWSPASYDAHFCSPGHRNATNTAHDRMISFE